MLGPEVKQSDQKVCIPRGESMSEDHRIVEVRA